MLLQSLSKHWQHPVDLLGVVSQQKSFGRNRVIGDRDLNDQGLHVWRVKTAAQLAARRRQSLSHRFSSDLIASFDRDGCFITKNYLPEDVFRSLRQNLLGGRFASYEMRQGQTVTRMTPIGATLRQAVPAIRQVVGNGRFSDQLSYAAGRSGAPIFFVQTVIANGGRCEQDPQTVVHADTFHATAKAWLFLQDVGPEDGPFQYVPGSHRLTPERLAWEHEQSLTATEATNEHHRAGSFRLEPGDLERMNLPAPRQITVPANTLVVADTFGFHGRTASSRSTMRVEIHGHLRRNPFMPWNGIDPLSLPIIRDNFFPIAQALTARGNKKSGKPQREEEWHEVGAIAVDAPASV